MNRNKLLKPIQAHEIEWRVQSQTKNKDKLIVVPYITNRCVMDRFDEAFGWENWNNEFLETTNGFICVMKINTDNGFVVKSDGASKTKIEPDKGGISDSMKRVAVQFGLGRDLYKYPKVFIETNNKYIPSWAYSEFTKLVKYIIEHGTYPKNIVIIKNKS